MGYVVERYHDFSAGHRVVGHETKCRFIHGHNYRAFFTCRAVKLDSVGRVIDFSDIKAKLCMWLEENWDHKLLLSTQDPLVDALHSLDLNLVDDSIVQVPFNPTAENMAQYLVEVVGPTALRGTGVELISCRVEETRKCSASFHVG